MQREYESFKQSLGNLTNQSGDFVRRGLKSLTFLENLSVRFQKEIERIPNIYIIDVEVN